MFVGLDEARLTDDADDLAKRRADDLDSRRFGDALDLGLRLPPAARGGERTQEP
jgi:hypothetical protein